MRKKKRGTYLKPEQAAIIWDPEDGFIFALPDYDEDTTVPDGVRLLLAMLISSRNPEWVEALMATVDDAMAAHKDAKK